MGRKFFALLFIVSLLLSTIGIFFFRTYKHSRAETMRNDYDKIYFYLVYRNETSFNYTRYDFKKSLKLVDSINFCTNKKTIIYTHGWIENFFSESVETVVDAFLTRHDYNIVVFDWGFYSFGEYFTVIPRFVKIAKILGEIIFQWHQKGFDIKKLHCIGHSFGSHLMGIMGREFKKLSNGTTVNRITALDPAHYGFFPSPIFAPPLSKNDADFVDAIHTDVNFLGTRSICGHVDFYPNNAALQPGCPKFSFKSYTNLVNNFCSHHHGWRYFAESVFEKQEKLFPALRCDSFTNLVNKKCDGNSINYMGLRTSRELEGTFYSEIKSHFNFTIHESYFLYLSTSFNYRSDLVKFSRHVTNALQQIKIRI